MVVGPTGIGKTYIACPLALSAIRAGHSALYVRTPRLMAEIAAGRADGRLPRLMRAWAWTDVLVLDDFPLHSLADQAAADLLEVIEDRAGLRSTIVTSQLPIALWHENLGEATIADAILDRLLAGAHRIELRGESMRRAEPAKQSSTDRTRVANSGEMRTRRGRQGEDDPGPHEDGQPELRTARRELAQKVTDSV